MAINVKRTKGMVVRKEEKVQCIFRQYIDKTDGSIQIPCKLDHTKCKM